jgi:hypothetical protein
MRKILRAAAPVLLLAAAFVFAAGDVVVLKGGARLELRKPPERQGSLVLLTRSDGTLLSVRAADVDWKATAAARNAGGSASQGPSVAGSPETPAEAARASREGPKARVKLTDADVGHVVEEESPAEKKDAVVRSGAGRLEVVDYAQERSGTSLIVRGTIRNTGGAPAANVKMTVTGMDEKGETIATGEAVISNGVVESGGTVSFSVTIPVGEKFVGSLRFAPQWLAPAAPAPAPGRSPVPAGPTPVAGKAASPASPAPAPTPYGRGTLYAAPAPSASTTPPADGNTGYLPGMSSPENQPKPPQ